MQYSLFDIYPPQFTRLWRGGFMCRRHHLIPIQRATSDQFPSTTFGQKPLRGKPTKSAVDDGTQLPQKPRFEDSSCRVLSAAGGTPHRPKKNLC